MRCLSKCVLLISLLFILSGCYDRYSKLSFFNGDVTALVYNTAVPFTNDKIIFSFLPGNYSVRFQYIKNPGSFLVPSDFYIEVKTRDIKTIQAIQFERKFIIIIKKDGVEEKQKVDNE